MSLVKALDVSSYSGPISDGEWTRAYEDGWGLAVVQAWGGLSDHSSGPNPLCEFQLAGARGNGFLTAIYIVIPPDDTVETHELIRVAKEAAGPEYQHVLFVAPDIEDAQRRPLHPVDPDARLHNALVNIGHPIMPIYTSRSMWADVMRESTAFAHLPLWDARWSAQQRLDDGWVPYGGWWECAMRQYQGTTIIHGITVDLNVADLDRLGVAEPPPDDGQAELERLRRQLQDIKAAAGQAGTLAQSVADSLRRHEGLSLSATATLAKSVALALRQLSER